MILLVLSFGTNLTVLKVVSPISSSLFVPGGIASFVGILDEFHQAFILHRNVSVTDVLLDIIGIALFIILMYFIATSFHQSDFSNFTCK
jgi:VanZ family protein